MFYPSWRMRQKFIVELGECATRLYASTEFKAILMWFYFFNVVSEDTKSILACMGIMHKEYKRSRRIRQEYFAAHWKYTGQHKNEPILVNFRPLQKNFLYRIEWAKNHLTLLSLLQCLRREGFPTWWGWMDDLSLPIYDQWLCILFETSHVFTRLWGWVTPLS